MGERQRRSHSLARASLVISLLALFLSTSGLASAARHSIVAAIDGHKISTKPHAGGLLVLGRNGKFPAAAIPTVKQAEKLDGMNVEALSACGPTTVNLGTWCLETSPFPVTNQEIGQNNYFWASQKCVEKGGYLPTHNPNYRMPQGPDPVWNNANCRNRRLFNDRAVKKVAANTRPFLVQTYRRDMGGGNFVLMKDVSSPITIRGRHWGAFRMGFRENG